MSDRTVTAFSCDGLPSDAQQRLRETAEAIRSSAHRQVDEIVATGTALMIAKAELSHGRFGAWITAEFRWSSRTAENYMKAAQAFGSNPKRVSHLPAFAVYRLASLPAPSRERILHAAEMGEYEIRSMIAQETHEAKRVAVVAGKSPKQREVEAEREKRRIAAHRKRETAWEAERQDERRKLEEDARKALALVSSSMLGQWREFLKLACGAQGCLWPAVHAALHDPKIEGVGR